MAGIENSDALTAIFGRWPSFHDSEILSVRLDRHGHDAFRGSTLEADIHVFEITSEVDGRGYFVLRNHTFVTLRFLQIDELRLDGFNCQNALFDLEIIYVTDRQLEDVKFEVHFRPSFGAGIDFLCKAIAVVQACAYDSSSRSE